MANLAICALPKQIELELTTKDTKDTKDTKEANQIQLFFFVFFVVESFGLDLNVDQACGKVTPR
jgi:hypothetical protein